MLDITAFSLSPSFDPETLQTMGVALDKARQQLRLSEKADPLTHLLAARIIDLASSGERDAERLREYAVRFLIN
jgi:hypothetical protein